MYFMINLFGNRVSLTTTDIGFFVIACNQKIPSYITFSYILISFYTNFFLHSFILTLISSYINFFLH